MTDKPQHYYEHYGRDNADEEATGLLADEEATGLLNAADEDTELLNNYDEEATGLLNTQCEQIHYADIIARGGRYFIVDLNSKNRTFVNGTPIPAQQETEIHDGDAIRLANEEFEFRI